MSLLDDLLTTIFKRREKQSEKLTIEERPIEDLLDALDKASGENTGRALARRILEKYQLMKDSQKLTFFRYLAKEMNIDPAKAQKTLDDYKNDPSKSNYRAFTQAVEPRRQEIIRRLNQLPGATEMLVRMRADLLRLMPDDEDIKALDIDFRHLFSSWFNRGFLVLRPINWESPANILEKIIAYEAVHAIGSWEDLRLRLEPDDRRCFAFFHPVMPDEPLIFVEVALTQNIPGSVQKLLSEDRNTLTEQQTTTAVFYSISNCQPGLAGISFGNSLIKQVVHDLSAEFPNLKTFVTLSPIPGLSRWLDKQNISVDKQNAEEVRNLAARYLLTAKRPDKFPLDPVARFHLGNGALIHQVHARADTSAKGLEQSLGTMVNYLYDLDRAPENHERFANRKEIVASADMCDLIKTEVHTLT